MMLHSGSGCTLGHVPVGLAPVPARTPIRRSTRARRSSNRDFTTATATRPYLVSRPPHVKRLAPRIPHPRQTPRTPHPTPLTPPPPSPSPSPSHASALDRARTPNSVRLSRNGPFFLRCRVSRGVDVRREGRVLEGVWYKEGVVVCGVVDGGFVFVFGVGGRSGRLASIAQGTTESAIEVFR
ncbi:hypothetical protein K439DRAFT_1617476 [Ramaria rubella]|nr:hypothetical protein K439DRAFT_1617476 [Ramaria rubella]